MSSSKVPLSLAEVSTSSLERVLGGLQSGLLAAPVSRDRLMSFGVTRQLDAIAAVLSGHSRPACIALNSSRCLPSGPTASVQFPSSFGRGRRAPAPRHATPLSYYESCSRAHVGASSSPDTAFRTRRSAASPLSKG